MELEYLLFDNHPAAMLICEEGTQKIYEANSAFTEMYGYSPEEITSRNLTFDALHAGTDGELFEAVDFAGKDDLFGPGIHRHYSDDGTLRYVKVASRPVGYQGKKARLVVLSDFTDQFDVLVKFRKSETLFKKLFTNAPQAIIMVDADNKIKQVNKSFETMFGYTAKELRGNDLNKMIKAREGYEKAPKISEVTTKNGRIYSELKRYTKDGRALNLVVGEIPVYLDNELIAGFGIYIDITGQKNAEKKLKKSLREKQVLLEEVHHRVKNNLAVVSGLLEMQTMHVNDPQLNKYIRNSQLRIKSMSIVHEMLYESKTLSQVRMDNYVKKLASVISRTLRPEDKNIDTVVESEPITLNVNQSIPSALIISELITNAYEYAFEEGCEGVVKVAISKKDEKVQVMVEDNGIGLPPNFKEMRKKSLGISLVETLCAQLKTEINIESGKWGTRFSFEFYKKDVSGSSSSSRVEKFEHV